MPAFKDRFYWAPSDPKLSPHLKVLNSTTCAESLFPFEVILSFQELGHRHLWEVTILPTVQTNLANVKFTSRSDTFKHEELRLLHSQSHIQPFIELCKWGAVGTVLPSSQINWSVCHDTPLTEILMKQTKGFVKRMTMKTSQICFSPEQMRVTVLLSTALLF